MTTFLKPILLDLGISDPYRAWVLDVLAFAGVLLLAVISYFVARRVVLRVVTMAIRSTTTRWDDALLESGVFERLARLAPAFVFHSFAYVGFPLSAIWIQRLASTYMVLVGVSVLQALIDSLVHIYEGHEISKEKPIKGYAQIVILGVYLLGGIIGFSRLIDADPWGLIKGLGALTAVLLLVFKDTLLSLVASVQITANRMVAIGDWVEMPSHGADGDVVDISLHVIKIQNWDKTISTVPTYAFISESFKNWRGMSESGGRRIKRAIHLDLSSVSFCSEEMLDRLEKIDCLRGYLETRRAEVAADNAQKDRDLSVRGNGRRLTNLGTFRAYLQAYLEENPILRKDMTFLVRQLAPGEKGVAIEIYVFSGEQRWAEYEGIQADIMDHVLAVLPEFGLRVFQLPTGHDLLGMTTERAAASP